MLYTVSGDYTQGNGTEFGLDTIETRSDTPVMIGESRLVAGDNEVTVVSDGDEVKLNVPDVSKFNLLLDYNDSVDITAVSVMAILPMQELMKTEMFMFQVSLLQVLHR